MSSHFILTFTATIVWPVCDRVHDGGVDGVAFSAPLAFSFRRSSIFWRDSAYIYEAVSDRGDDSVSLTALFRCCSLIFQRK